ncbi:MAG: DMT family transporter [Clostridia bacterium]|nr:DMT family transporter [Clostridia bacterium]
MQRIKSFLLLLMTAMIWGFAFVAQRVGADYVGAFTFNGIRFVLGAISLIPVIFIFEKAEKDSQIHTQKMSTTFKTGVVAGIILFTASSLQQVGIEITGSAGKASFLTGLYTVLVPIFGIALGKKTTANVWLGAVLAVVGMFFICVNEKWQISIGDIVLIIGAIFWAFHILVIDRFVNKMYAIRFASTQFAVCGILGICCALIFEKITLDAILNALIPILYGGVLSAGVAYTCQIIGQKKADPTYASIILSTESMFGAIGGALILHEVMTIRGYFGCALIFTGVIISQLVFKKKFKKIAV